MLIKENTVFQKMGKLLDNASNKNILFTLQGYSMKNI